MPHRQKKSRTGRLPVDGAANTNRRHLPRRRIEMTDAQIVDHIRRLGYKVNIEQIGFTIESIADFIEARDRFWSKIGTVCLYDPPGLLVVEDARPREMQPIRDVLVVSLGNARAVMGVMNPDPMALTPRYARYME